MNEFTFTIDDLSFQGKDLTRPECVCCVASGVVVTSSTRRIPRSRAYRKDHADGYIVLSDERGTRIVADGIGYTNEAIVDPSVEWLVVNETMGRRTSRFRIRDDGSLGKRDTVTEYGEGVFPDGLAFDEEGAFWMTSVLSNRLIRVTPHGL